MSSFSFSPPLHQAQYIVDSQNILQQTVVTGDSLEMEVCVQRSFDLGL